MKWINLDQYILHHPALEDRITNANEKNATYSGNRKFILPEEDFRAVVSLARAATLEEYLEYRLFETCMVLLLFIRKGIWTDTLCY